ncbi:MAG: exodeoxyribonuclease VII large subunit [Rhodanobacter sp.]|nr:MAG: exodeoxyribonuclease VII large subunit [Rhodanobacter sp.]TAM08622.1 MAG: exodeoxyribonuclease VII large subunit [Rhodanobacter sp.]TAM34418.1 MAG: exodeoxyribonuclease VII large subunit [Rhodanobacter sp.]
MSAPDASPAPNRQVLTPSTLNRLVRGLLEDAFPTVWIEGELSNVARPASGHLYFTLKDSAAQVRCAMFRSSNTGLRFKPADGLQVLLRARVGLYEARGEYQLIAEHMELAGEGALQRAFEALKAKLDAEGLFDAKRKRPLPPFARRIGVITSATGAAIRDVLSVLGRRWPLAEVDVLPVPVQGREAPPAIVAMLRKAAASRRYDVLLVTRGGGSLEDLWAFNDEAVARAIHASPVPVMSAVGHEIDFSIADFVADVRAPTPSAAAEILVPDAQAMLRRLRQQQSRLATAAQRTLQALGQRLDTAAARLQAQRPEVRLARNGERLANLHHRLLAALRTTRQQHHARLVQLQLRLRACDPQRAVGMHRNRLTELAQRLRQAVARQLERRKLALQEAARTLHAVSPLATLERGYAIVRDADGHVVTSVTGVHPGDTVQARLADGTLHAKVIDAA